MTFATQSVSSATRSWAGRAVPPSVAFSLAVIVIVIAIIVLLRMSWARAERRYLRLLDRALLEAPSSSTALSEVPVSVRQ